LTIEAIRTGKPSPIPFQELAEVTKATFLVQRSLATRETLRMKNTGIPVAPLKSSPELPDAAQRSPAGDGDFVRLSLERPQ
jgi:hypothetical protein